MSALKKWGRSLVCSLSAFLILIMAPLSVWAASYPAPTQGFFVNDFADVIDDAQEKQMQQWGESLYKNTQAQVVAVTVKSLEGQDVRDYAIALARAWKIGDNEKNNNHGVLLIFALEERKVSIEVGTGLEGDLTDGRTGRILDEYAIPDFKNNLFSDGMSKTYQALTEFVAKVYSGEPIQEEDVASDDKYDRYTSIIIALVVVLCILFFTIRRPRLFFPGGWFYGGGGGFSGGSSSGGGGGFSGGGGGFSGGGSSRGF